MDKLNIPYWEEFKAENDTYLNSDQYVGAYFIHHLGQNLHFGVECRNESCIWKNKTEKDNLIHVFFGTKQGFAIASADYEYSVNGYYSAICQALVWADEFSELFKEFNENLSFVNDEGNRECNVKSSLQYATIDNGVPVNE